MRKQVKVGAITYAHLIKNMMHGDMNCRELADETGLHYVTVLQYTRELHAVGAAHISRFDADAQGRHNIKVYKLGQGKDAKRVRMTAVQRRARYLERRKSLANPLFRLGEAHGQDAH